MIMKNKPLWLGCHSLLFKSVYVCIMHIHMCTCGSQARVLECLFLRTAIYLVFCFVLFPTCFLTGTWGLPVRLGWLSSELQKSTCLYLPHAGITVGCHTQLCLWSLMIKFRSSGLHCKHFYTPSYMLSRAQGLFSVMKIFPHPNPHD